MEATNKKLLFAALGLGVLLLVNRAGQVSDTINGLTFKCGIGGVPHIQGISITFPIRVSVTNPSPVGLPLEGLGMTLDRLAANGTTTPIAATNPNGVPTPSIAANAVTSFIVPVTTDFLSALSEVISAIQNRGLGRYVLRTTILSAGIKVPLPAQVLSF